MAFTPEEWARHILKESRDQYQRQADRLMAERDQRNWAHDQEVIDWSLKHVAECDRILAVAFPAEAVQP